MSGTSALRAIVLGLGLGVLGLPATVPAAEVVAVPPARQMPLPIVPRTAGAHRLLPAAAPSHAIALPSPTGAERDRLKAANAPRNAKGARPSPRAGKGQPLAIGFGRSAPATLRQLDGAALAWVSLADGGFAARVSVASEGAAAMRIGLATKDVEPGVTVRFAGAAADAPVFGPYPGNTVAVASQHGGVFWSPVLEGDTATIEIYRPAGVAPGALQFTLARVSHLAIAGGSLGSIAPKDLADIGAAGSCEIDVACVRPLTQSLRDAASAVAKMLFTTADGGSYLCSGTLLNDSAASGTPYFFTAAHCIDSAVAARTVNTYWFFEAQSCGRTEAPPFVLLSGGAMLLGRSDDWDWALLRLNEPPPAGANFAAWRAEPVPEEAIGTTIHHPGGDLKKWSQGTTAGYGFIDDGTGASFVRMQWNQGATEWGSSGSALYTFLGSGGYYELRGGLFGGESSCSNQSGTDYYTRLDKALPYLSQYLTPKAASADIVVPVVEFYSRAIGHYFIASDPFEIGKLDSGAEPGWERTGLRFLAYANPFLVSAETTPVCRFYLAPPWGNTHFHSGDPGECAMVRSGAMGPWIYESSSVFHIQPPDQATGACPAETRPVWRFFNTYSVNHRYTAEVLVRDNLRLTPGWVAEGYGPDKVIMCAPDP